MQRAARLVLLMLLAIGLCAVQAQDPAPYTPATDKPTEKTEAPAPPGGGTTITTLAPGTESTSAAPAPTTPAPTTQRPRPTVGPNPIGSTPVAYDADPCAYMSCALGQLLTDGLRAHIMTTKQDWWKDSTPRVVMVNGNEIQGALDAGSLSKELLVWLLPNANQLLCQVNMSAPEVYILLDKALAGADTFPQVSGLWVEYDSVSKSAKSLWAQTAGLAMRSYTRQDGHSYILLTAPCSVLNDSGKTDIKLEAGLTWYIPKDKDNYLVPPLVENRVRPYIGLTSRDDLCEDWVGMTVAYTLLVLGSIVMVGYQCYQFWRFRSTLSYVR